MAIEAILEKEWKTIWVELLTGIKAKLILHCSCGHDYKITERFPARYIGGDPKEYIRPTQCPKCKEKDYLMHITQRPSEERFRYGVEILRDTKTNQEKE